MDIFRAAERLMSMDDATWRRHCHPWSGWSPMLTGFRVFTLAIWNWVWLSVPGAIARI
ncbi:MAG: hypothetical protein ABJL99_17275 [Aliishimia sp.]